MDDETVYRIAIEHVRWARADGKTLSAIVASVGETVDRSRLHGVLGKDRGTFDGAVDAIARAQVRLNATGMA